MSRLTLKRKISQFWPSNTQNRKIILLYHSVGDTPWGLSCENFAKQVSWLADHCKVLSLTELIQAKPSQDIQVAITFDDGYVTLHDNAAPIAAKNHIKPTVYINTGWIGESAATRHASEEDLGHYPNEQFLTWDEVNALQKAGWEIGSHGVNHYNFAEETDAISLKELETSKQVIEAELDTPCTHFAYPWGRYTHRLKNIVSAAGYTYATAARHGILKPNSDVMALPRINIAKDYSFEDFQAIVKGKWDYLGWIQKIKGM